MTVDWTGHACTGLHPRASQIFVDSLACCARVHLWALSLVVLVRVLADVSTSAVWRDTALLWRLRVDRRLHGVGQRISATRQRHGAGAVVSLHGRCA